MRRPPEEKLEDEEEAPMGSERPTPIGPVLGVGGAGEDELPSDTIRKRGRRGRTGPAWSISERERGPAHGPASSHSPTPASAQS